MFLSEGNMSVLFLDRPAPSMRQSGKKLTANNEVLLHTLKMECFTVVAPI
jgi:hypothetical protein